MGVLKVLQADGSWRNVGCDGAGTTPTNLLTTNQSTLESGTTTGWTAEPDPSFGTVYTVLTADTTHVHSGSYALKAGVSAATGRYFSTPAGTSGFPVTAGEAYAVGGWVYRVDGSGQSRVLFSMRWYSASGAFISTTTGQQYAPAVNSWQQINFQASGGTNHTAPAGAAFGQLFGQCIAANNLFILFWFDDMTVTAIPGPTVGRLKLWDGTRWVREACASDTGADRHPLKLWDGTTWQTVACMIPA